LLQKSIFLIRISQYNLPIMKELLYLKDEQIKDFIQLLFYAYKYHNQSYFLNDNMDTYKNNFSL